MAEGYDFEKYYKNTTAKAEINLDLSGVNIENPAENLNEKVTNNVRYFVSYIWGSNDSTFSTYKQFDINDRLAICDQSDTNDDGSVITKYYFGAPLHSIDDIIDSDCASMWDPDDTREFWLDLDTQESGSGITYYHCDDSAGTGTVFTPYSYIRIFVFPRYEAIDGNPANNVLTRILGNPLVEQSSTVNQNIIGVATGNYSELPKIMYTVYGITGICGSNYMGFKWLQRNVLNAGRLVKNLKRNAVISEKSFKKRIKNMASMAADKNYGIDVKYYDKSYMEEVTVEDATKADYKRSKSMAALKHRVYKKALDRADITKTPMGKRTSYNDAYGTYLPKFLSDAKCSQLVDNMVPTSAGVTALIPPLKDAVKAIFYDTEDLENDFFECFESSYQGLMKVAGRLRRYIRKKTVAKLTSVGTKYQSAPTGNHDLAFDMSYMVNILQSRCSEISDASGNPANGIYGLDGAGSNGICCFPRIYARSATTVSNVILDNHGTSHTGYAVWAFTPGIVKPKNSQKFVGGCFCHWAVPSDSGARQSSTYYKSIDNGNVFADDYYFVGNQNSIYKEFTDSYAPRNKIVSTMSGSEVKELLVEYYNWACSYNNYDVDFMYTVDDLCTVNDVRGNYIYGWNPSLITEGKATIPSGHSGDSVSGLNQFVEFVGGYMNFFNKYKSDDQFADRAVHINAGPANSVWQWVLNLVTNNICSWTIDDNATFDVIDWGKASTTSNVCSANSFTAGYESEWTLDSETPSDIDEAMQYAILLQRTYKEVRHTLWSNAFSIGTRTVLRCWQELADIDDDIDKLFSTMQKVNWYQLFANESAFTNKSIIGNFSDWLRSSTSASADDSDEPAAYSLGMSVWNLPARFMVPVHMTERRKVRVKIFGRTRHRYRRFSIGIRWAEVRFYDLNVYNEYPQVPDTPGRMVDIGVTGEYSRLSNGTYSIEVDESLNSDIIDAGGGELVVNGDTENRIQVTVSDETTLITEDTFDDASGTITLTSIKLPPDKSKNDTDTKSNVTISYKLPSLPYDEEIRKKAFVEYGPFSQNKLFEVYRFGDGGFGTSGERHDGWKIFHDSSKKLEDLRDGIDIYRKAAMLLSILRHEFGKERVEIIDTYRSADDEAMYCAGAGESAFLSWHNYGLAVKIVIYQDDLSTPIVDKSDDMKKLTKIARAFTECCNSGVFGPPCNLIWCGRLVINPSLFDWEFLPVGVNHKDAPKFRDYILSQKDPVVELGYVNVDSNNYAVDTARTDGLPYILKTSSAYKNATVINGQHYVAPRNIRNYSTPDDIVLYDIIEFINLIQTKMDANGTTLTGKASMREWKALNDESCTQLIMYYALTNNVSAAKSLIAGEYMEHYQPIEDSYYQSDAVSYVKGMLGTLYDEAVVTVDRDTDASYITLKDGILHVRATDIFPDNLATMVDMHKQQSVDRNRLKHGIWKDGVFYDESETDIPYTDSESPVVGGYDDISGEPVSGDAMYLHRVVAAQIHDEFTKNSKMFLDFKGALLYDNFQDGPNADMYDMLENEFGLIKAQDLMDFDTLDAIVGKDSVPDGSDKSGDGGTVYEEMVDNAELAGIRKASITREKVHINDRANGMTAEQLYKLVTKGVMPSANDVIE